MKMKTLLTLTVAGATLGAATSALAEKIVVRETSMRTFSGTINDEEGHPVLVIDDLKNPRPIGPGRGAGGYVFLNNKLLDPKTGKELGLMRGICFTIDHGPDGPWKGKIEIGAGGPFPSACQLAYELPDGQLVANGIIDLNAMELDKAIPVAIVGGTGKYQGARGQVTITQDPPGQPITYKVVLDFKK
jgi:hypothetical protein